MLFKKSPTFKWGFLMRKMMIISFTDAYKVDKAKFEATEAFDPILGIDTRLFIDPSLIRNTKIPEFQNAYSKIQIFFEDIIRLLKQTKNFSKRFILEKSNRKI